MNESISWKLYTAPEEAWEAMLESIEKAKASVDFEQYTIRGFRPGQIGRRFMETLERKAQEGLRVRAIFDSFGSTELLFSGWPTRLRRAGAAVRFYQLKSKWELWRFPLRRHRDHRKLAVIDGKEGFIGGVVETEEIRGFSDLHACFAGPIVQFFQKAFDDLWQRLNHDGKSLIRTLPPRHHGEFSLLANAGDRSCRYLHRNIRRRLADARRRIWIVTPYFSPTFRTVRRLVRAARRGADVSIIVPARSDVRLADYVGWNYYLFLSKRGVKILFQNERKLHEKLVIIDDWATFGSANFDQLSFFNNHELNIATNNRLLLEQLGALFEEKRGTAFPCTEELAAARSTLDRIKTRLAFFLRRWV